MPRAIQVLCLVGTPTPVMNLHHDVRELFFFSIASWFVAAIQFGSLFVNAWNKASQEVQSFKKWIQMYEKSNKINKIIK